MDDKSVLVLDVNHRHCLVEIVVVFEGKISE